MLSNFSQFALSRSEMKNVVGGGCAVCSSGGSGGTCGGYDFTSDAAKAMANSYNSNNPDPSNPYYYYVHCN
jgi:natural product precursor